MQNHDRRHLTRGVEQSFPPRACEKRTFRLADRTFQNLPELESGAAENRDHLLCGMRCGINLHRTLLIPKPRAPTGRVSRGVKPRDEKIRRLGQHARPLSGKFAQVPNMLGRKRTDSQVKPIAWKREPQAVGSDHSSSNSGLLLRHRQHRRRQVNSDAERRFCRQQLLEPTPGPAPEIEYAPAGDAWK
jgi:hypothetical protein